jgi:hypothetical protein
MDVSWTRRLLFSGLAMAAFTRKAPAAEPSTQQDWLPDRKTIEEIESAIAMPPGAQPLANYRRRYGGEIEAGHHVIWGYFLLPTWAPNDPPIAIVGHRPVELVEDGGCSVVTLKYDANSKTILWIQCNGEA